MPITIRDVAQKAGVSAGTVSLVLNKKPGISDATRQRVEEALKSLDYKPNAAAQRLVTRQIRTIGIIYSEHLRSGGVPSGFMMDVFEGIRSVTDTHQANLVLVSVAEEFREDHLGVHMMHKDKLDGVLLVAVDPESPYLQLIRDSGLAYVDINRRLDDDGASYVVLDYEGAAVQAVRHLQDCGYGRVGLLLRGDRPGIARDIRSGYLRAVGGGSIDESLVEKHDGSEASGREAMSKLLERGLRAAFVSDNAAAVGAIRAAQDSGLRVPEQCGIVGMFDYKGLPEGSTTLTSITYPTDELGRTGVDTLLRLMENQSLAAQRSVVKTVLSPGQSTRATCEARAALHKSNGRSRKGT